MKKWIQAARVRTLPLCLSGIFLGTLLAIGNGFFNESLFILSCLSAICFQIVANFANDYGDAIKGVDKDRIGQKRMVSSGLISPSSMKKAIILFSLLSFFFSFLLIFFSFDKWNLYFLIFLLLTLLCIYAAIGYTIGKKAYGYKGIGDIAVFIFFGLVSVKGSYFLYLQRFDKEVLLPACAIGLLSVAVLNLNNMRDIKNDKEKGKNTFVVQIGLLNARIYHLCLLLSSFILGFLFVFLHYKYPYQYSFMILLIPLFFHLKKILSPALTPEILDAELKKISLITLLYAILIGIGQAISFLYEMNQVPLST